MSSSSCNSEAIAENCNEPLGYAGLVDIKDPSKPRLCSLFPLPRPPEDAPYRNFCEKGGRFGPHNQHQCQYQDLLLHDENLCFLTYFNAGLRVFDISDDKLVKEIAYFVPPDPLKQIGMLPKSSSSAKAKTCSSTIAASSTSPTRITASMC